MILNSDVTAEYQSVNTAQVAALGIYDDSNGAYFMLHIMLANGNKITWKYDDKKKRDDKLAEAQQSLNK